LAAVQLAKSIGTTVLATTRSEKKSELLIKQGADHVLIENGKVSEQLQQLYPNGADKILEFIGPLTLPESLRMLNRHGIVCVTGILGKKGTLENFYPIKDIPTGVYLTGFSSNNPTQIVIDKIFSHLKTYNLHPTIAGVFHMSDISLAHQLMENNAANGKVIINTTLR